MPDINVIEKRYGLEVVVTEANWNMPREYALSVAAQHLTNMGYGDAHAVSSTHTNPHTWTLTYAY